MTSIREPRPNDRLKQVVYPWITTPKKYTTAWMNEDDYRQTPTWLALRDRTLLRDGYRCKHCGSAMHLEVHHIKYPEVWGEERLDDLITLCHDCHESLHNTDIERRKA